MPDDAPNERPNATPPMLRGFARALGRELPNRLAQTHRLANLTRAVLKPQRKR